MVMHCSESFDIKKVQMLEISTSFTIFIEVELT